MAHTGMTKDQFKVGGSFWTATGKWYCDYVGKRIIVATKEDGSYEVYFDEHDFGGCSLEPFDN